MVVVISPIDYSKVLGLWGGGCLPYLFLTDSYLNYLSYAFNSAFLHQIATLSSSSEKVNCSLTNNIEMFGATFIIFFATSKLFLLKKYLDFVTKFVLKKIRKKK